MPSALLFELIYEWRTMGFDPGWTFWSVASARF